MRKKLERSVEKSLKVADYFMPICNYTAGRGISVSTVDLARFLPGNPISEFFDMLNDMRNLLCPSRTETRNDLFESRQALFSVMLDDAQQVLPTLQGINPRAGQKIRPAQVTVSRIVYMLERMNSCGREIFDDMKSPRIMDSLRESGLTPTEWINAWHDAFSRSELAPLTTPIEVEPDVVLNCVVTQWLNGDVRAPQVPFYRHHPQTQMQMPEQTNEQDAPEDFKVEFPEVCGKVYRITLDGVQLYDIDRALNAFCNSLDASAKRTVHVVGPGEVYIATRDGLCPDKIASRIREAVSTILYMSNNLINGEQSC